MGKLFVKKHLCTYHKFPWKVPVVKLFKSYEKIVIITDIIIIALSKVLNEEETFFAR